MKTISSPERRSKVKRAVVSKNGGKIRQLHGFNQQANATFGADIVADAHSIKSVEESMTDAGVGAIDIPPGMKASEQLKNVVWDTTQGSSSNNDGISVSQRTDNDFTSSQTRLVGGKRSKPTDPKSIVSMGIRDSSKDSLQDNLLNTKTRRERNMMFVSYIREQMLHEYGVDLNTDIKKQSEVVGDGPLAQLKKVKNKQKEQYFERNKLSKQYEVALNGRNRETVLSKQPS